MSTLHASRLVYAARCAMAKLLHAPDPSCIAFAANATEALNIALGGLFAPGDHIITTVCEHNSVLRPLYRLREQGLQFSFAGVDERGRLQYDDWDKLVQPNTKALVVTGASNVTGNGTNLAKAAGFAHRHGLLLIVDAAQTAGSQSIDVQALGIDVLCFTGHKALLGPQGTGGLYVRPGLSIQPLVVGAAAYTALMNSILHRCPPLWKPGRSMFRVWRACVPVWNGFWLRVWKRCVQRNCTGGALL